MTAQCIDRSVILRDYTNVHEVDGPPPVVVVNQTGPRVTSSLISPRQPQQVSAVTERAEACPTDALPNLQIRAKHARIDVEDRRNLQALEAIAEDAHITQ